MASRQVAFFVSAHGFGHAARACALIDEMAATAGFELQFHLFTTAPEWFFRESLRLPLTVWQEPVDVGPVQRTALEIDGAATGDALRGFFPIRSARRDELAARLRRLGVDLVVADIAPLGLAVAEAAGIPSVLVENFTWDWIYRRLPLDGHGLAPLLEEMEQTFSSADLHLQTLPICAPDAGYQQTGPLARRPRSGRAEVRAGLGVEESAPLALLSMGGVPWHFDGLGLGRSELEVVVVGDCPEAPPRVRVLPHHSPFHHPDLVAAADLVVGKLGYSTVAEAWQAQCAMLWVERPDWPETEVLADHVGRVLPSRSIPVADLQQGRWVEPALDLIGQAAPRRPYEDGRPAAAEAVLTLLGRGGIP